MEHIGSGSDAGALDGDDEGRRSVRHQRAGFSIFLDQVADDDSGTTHWETRLYHAESGSETSLPGASPDDWIGWLLEHIGAVDAGADVRGAAARAVVEVASVEIIDVRITDDAPSRSPSLHTITANVVVQLTGVSGVERTIGSKILRGLSATVSIDDGPPTSRE